MERKIGSTFTDNGVELRVEEGAGCEECHFFTGYVTYQCIEKGRNIRGHCSKFARTDKTGVIFTEVKTE